MPEAKPGGFPHSLSEWRWVLLSEPGLGGSPFCDVGRMGRLLCAGRGSHLVWDGGPKSVLGQGSPSLCGEGISL